MITQRKLWIFVATCTVTVGRSSNGLAAALHSGRFVSLISHKQAQRSPPTAPPLQAPTARAKAGPRLVALQSGPPPNGGALQLPNFLAIGRHGGANARGAGLGMSGAYNDPRMDCSAGRRDAILTDKSPGIARAMLAGAAAAGVGAGVVLLLTAPTRSQTSHWTPGIGIDLALQKLSANAVWRF